MDTNNDSIVKNLIQYYSNQGVDASHILANPLFDKMKPLDKIALLRRYSGQLARNQSSGLSSSEKAKIWESVVLNGIATGGAVGAFATAVLRTGKYATPAIHKAIAAAAIPAVLAGVMAGGITGYAQTHSTRAKRQAIQNSLTRLARDPSEYNAIAALSTSHVHGVRDAYKSELIEKAIGNMTPRVVSTVNESLPELTSSAYSYFNHKP